MFPHGQSRFSPSPRQLRQFAAVLPCAVFLVSWLWGRDVYQALGISCVGLLLASLAWLWPPLIKPLYVSLTVLGLPIGWLLGELVMGAVYFGLITPLACWFRLRHRDPLQLELDKPASSYWQTKRPVSEPSSYLRRW